MLQLRSRISFLFGLFPRLLHSEESRGVDSLLDENKFCREQIMAALKKEHRSQSFSYLSLAPQNGEFPHRTVPIGGPQTASRRGSTSSGTFTGTAVQGSLLVRNNPIGLAGPSVKRDGYAVGKDGSMYRSSENLFTEHTISGKRNCRSSSASATPDRDLSNGALGGRRKSWTVSQQGGIRMGSGLVSASNRRDSIGVGTLPFGGKQSKYSASTLSSSKKKVRSKWSSTTTLDQTEIETSTTMTLNSSSSTSKQISSTTASATVTRTSLPEQHVTLSLPASRRISRNVSEERDLRMRTAARSRKASIEVFEGSYVVKMKSGNTSRRASTTTATAPATATATVQAVTEKKASVMTSVSTTEDVTDGMGPKEAGMALRDLTKALEKLEKQQKTITTTKETATAKKLKKSTSRAGSSTSIDLIVSLPPSQRSSRATSPDKFRSRKNSLDVYSSKCTVRLPSVEPEEVAINTKRRSRASSEQRDICHIRCDENTKAMLMLCARCHGADHTTDGCIEFGTLSCPRCLQWPHWEDTCPALDSAKGCMLCQRPGHVAAVHGATGFPQRRMVVDTLGWEPFQTWFHEPDFRSWWQLNGCTGVPLYRIYKRNTEWKTVAPPVEEDAKLTRKDSYENLLSEVDQACQALRTKRRDNEGLTLESSSSSPPPEKDNDADADDAVTTSYKNQRRLRTYSETIRNMDEDILKDLNV